MIPRCPRFGMWAGERLGWTRTRHTWTLRIGSSCSTSVTQDTSASFVRNGGGDDRLARQAIEAFDESSHSRRHHAGAGSPPTIFRRIPTFSLLWVGMLHDFAMYRSDPAFVREHLPGTRAVLDWYVRHQEQERFGWTAAVVELHRLGQWFSRRRSAAGRARRFCSDYAAFCRGASGGRAELEDFVRRQAARRELYRRRLQRAVQGVKKLCWNKGFGIVCGHMPAQMKYSQHTNLMAVLLDVFPKEQQLEVMMKVLSDSDPGFKINGNGSRQWKKLRTTTDSISRELLDHAGMGDRYLELLNPWKEMLALGLTTWAETPEPTRSDSHAWSAHPNYDLLTIVAGNSPGRTGFERACDPEGATSGEACEVKDSEFSPVEAGGHSGRLQNWSAKHGRFA